MDRVRNEEECITAGIENELASRADQRVLRWFGMWNEWRSIVQPEGVDGGSVWRAGTRETEVRLDGWCEGGLRQQRKDDGGYATMGNRSERVESPGTYVTE